MEALNVPISDAVARVRMIDTTGVMVVNAESFIEPMQPGHDFLNLYVAVFLIEHAPSGTKVMFDLGVRKDFWELPAMLQKRLGHVIPALRVDKDTTEILQENGVDLGDISSVIWSHYHWDHTGSMELFPPTTELVVGPGFKDCPILLPGFPHNPDSPLDSRAMRGRILTEVAFTNLRIGGLRAHDYFGDGSVYLLDTPGHCIGHLCCLVRTTGGPESTFVLLGGDSCHFPGCLRPNSTMQLPETIPAGTLDEDAYFPTPCPGSLFADCYPAAKPPGSRDTDEYRCTPFYKISTKPSAAYANPSEAQATLEQLLHFDADPSVLVCLSHDETMLRSLPTLNEDPDDDLNEWKSRGFKDKIYWGWLNHLPRSKQPGRKRALEGFWRDGKPWPEAHEVLRKNGEAASGFGL